MSAKLAAAFTQLATGSFDSPPVRRALLQDIATVFGGQDAGWGTPTGTPIKTTFDANESTTVSNPPTQAEVQAINNRLKQTRQLLAALIETLILE